MISDKIKALFQFIEFLHSNIENFNQYNDLIKELELLKTEKNKLNPENNYKDKLLYDKTQTELESKFKTLQDNTANLIKAKAKELNVCNFNNEPNYSFNGVEAEIHHLKKNFSNENLPEIFKHKSLYLEYRSQTPKTFLSLQSFFNNLDRITKSLFDFFKETEQNEFEAFETKAIQVNSIEEAVKGLKHGYTKFHISPTPQNRTKSKILKSLADFNFFQITVISDLEFEGETYKNVEQKNNDSILTPENWEQHKDTFFEQRIAIYKDSYTLKEKIKLEHETLEKLPINETDYKILKERYTNYLRIVPPQPIKSEQSRTKKEIAKQFEEMDIKKGWEYAFRSETDYNAFTDILTNFFEYKDYRLPEVPIKLKRGCKTRLAATLGKIHSELSNIDKFSSDTNYFKIVKSLHHFEDLSVDEIYKALTRFRKD